MGDNKMFVKDNKMWKIIQVIFPIITLFLSINQIFNIKLFGFLPMLNEYLYYLLAFNLSLVFITYPAKKEEQRNVVKWYDALLFVLSFALNIYFAIHSEEMILKAWEQYAPKLPTILSVFEWMLVIEAVRRTNGKMLAVFCTIFSLYPLFANKMPSVLSGQSYNFLAAAKMHILGINSILGIPLQVVGSLLIGFMFFGVVLQYSGGGKFFMDFSH